MTARAGFSRPGQRPYLTAHLRAAGHPAPDEVVLLDYEFSMVRGDLCEAGRVTLSAPPFHLRPGDWVQVWLPEDPPDDPTYLGEAIAEPWGEGKGEVQVRALRESVRRARWTGKNKALFREFLLTALSRCVLPPGVTVGEIAADPATLQADTPHEQLGDTLDAAMPALEGGTWGLDGRGRLHVRAPDTRVTHRFVLGQAETPPGKGEAYANCVRFPYLRPDGVQAWFEGRIPEEVARRGEVWEEVTLPSSVAVTQVNPYAGLDVGLTLTLRHPDLNEWQPQQDLDALAFSPDWGGRLATAANTGLLYGTALTLGVWTDSSVTLQSAGTPGLVITAPPPGLQLERVADGVATPVAINSSGAAWHPAGSPWRDVYNPYQGLAAGQLFTLRYTVESVNAYRDAHGQMPPAFRVGVLDTPGASAAVTAAAAVNPLSRRLVPAPLTEVDLGSGHRRYEAVPRAFGFAPTTRIVFPTARTWQAGDTVTTDAAVTAVQAELNTNPPTVLGLTRAEDDPDTGRRVWALPQNYQLSALLLTGPPDQIGWVGVRLSDVSGLTRYADGLLRYRTQPVRVWRGRYPELRRMPARGRAIVEHRLLGEVALDVQRVTYSHTAGVTVEVGTPLPLESEVFGTVIENVRRDVRRASG